jgi:hypothetical protein
MSNQTQVIDMIKQLAGQSNILTVPRLFIDLTGEIESALFLSQCIYWSDKTKNPDCWFYKTGEEWEEEITLSRYKISKAVKVLGGIIETKLKKANGSPTIHYRVNFQLLENRILKKIENPISKNLKNDIEKTSKTLTETTTETTTDINIYAPKNGAKPKPEPKQTAPKADLDAIVAAIAKVTQVNTTQVNYPRLAHLAKTLYLSKYTAETIQAVYGAGGAYWRDDWRGKKGQRPTLAAIQDSIDGLAPKAKPAKNPNNPNGLSDKDYAEALETIRIINPKAYERELEAMREEREKVTA